MKSYLKCYNYGVCGGWFVCFLFYFFSLRCDFSSKGASLKSVEEDNTDDEEAGVKHLNRVWPSSAAGVHSVWVRGSWWGKRCDHPKGSSEDSPPLRLRYQYSLRCRWLIGPCLIGIWVLLDNVEEGGLQQAEAGREQGPSAPRGGGWALSLVTFPRGRRHLSAEFRRLTWYNQLGQPTTSRLRAFPRGRRTPDVRDSVSRFSRRQQNVLPPKYPFGIWITLSWNQSRPRRLRKTFVPLSLLKTVDRGPDPGGKHQSPEVITAGARCVAGRSPPKPVKFLPVSRCIYLAQQTFIYQTFAFMSPCQLPPLPWYPYILYMDTIQ